MLNNKQVVHFHAGTGVTRHNWCKRRYQLHVKRFPVDVVFLDTCTPTWQPSMSEPVGSRVVADQLLRFQSSPCLMMVCWI